MLPTRSQNYPSSFPAPVWYLHLVEQAGDEVLERAGFYPNEHLLDTAKALVAKQDRVLAQFLSQRVFWWICYDHRNGDEESLAINNRRIIPLNWFRQIADSKLSIVFRATNFSKRRKYPVAKKQRHKERNFKTSQL